MISIFPRDGVRRIITGFLFGTTGCLITLSPVGKISGAHINPAVSLAFWLQGTMKTGAMLAYIVSQMIGAAIGSFLLLFWGSRGSTIDFGNTVPGSGGLLPAFTGESLTTAGLVITLFIFAGRKTLRAYTPYTLPFLYGIMVWLEAPFSGCSTNPARSFGPALISGVFTSYWLYWLAPMTGILLVTTVFRALKMHHKVKLHSARVSYHDSPTHENIRAMDEQNTIFH